MVSSVIEAAKSLPEVQAYIMEFESAAIKSLKEKVPYLGGVYGIWHNNKLIYIGQSKCLYERKGNSWHRFNKRVLGECKCSFILCPDLDLRLKIEGVLIRKHRPRFNTGGIYVRNKARKYTHIGKDIVESEHISIWDWECNEYEKTKRAAVSRNA